MLGRRTLRWWMKAIELSIQVRSPSTTPSGTWEGYQSCAITGIEPSGDDGSRVSGRGHPRGHVTRDDGAGRDARSGPDPHPLEHDRADPHPGAVADRHRFRFQGRAA